MSHKILIVDDEPSIREILENFLTKQKYQVTTAESGEEAVQLLSGRQFSLVLCDVMMDGWDGIRTLAEIKRIDKLLPVIMMSGFGTHDLVIKALEKGAADFIAKPISLIQANKIIKTILTPRLKAALEYHSPLVHFLRESYFGFLRLINSHLEAKFPYIKEHSCRVALHAAKIGEALKLPDGTVEVISCAAELHDIGKIRLPDMIIAKPAQLTEAEWAEMRMHPVIGSMMIEQLRFFRAEEPLIRHHHERYDGGGYPKGLKGEDIPLGARIISLADAYDAMTSVRPYRKAIGAANARKIITEYSGTQFDPKIAGVFLSVV